MSALAGAKHGQRRGGRKAGTPNKSSLSLAARIRQKLGDFDPVVFMCELAADETNEKKLRLQAAAEVAQYLAPKLRAVDLTGSLTMSHERALDALE